MKSRLSAAELRAWAAKCDERSRVATAPEIENLVRMRNHLLAQARLQEWIDSLAA